MFWALHILTQPSQELLWYVLFYPDFTGKETEAQRGWEICPSKWQSQVEGSRACVLVSTTACYIASLHASLSASPDSESIEGPGHPYFNSSEHASLTATWLKEMSSSVLQSGDEKSEINFLIK